MFRTLPARSFLLCLLTASALSGAANAQALRPPSSLRNDGGVEFAQGVDAAGMGLRIDRLENQVRTLTGQLEQMQFQNKRLEDALKKFQQDVEFRFQEGKGAAPAGRAAPPAPAGRRGEAQEPGAPASASAALSPEGAPLSPAPATRLGRRAGGDAFDPDSNPGAPGAPRQLGSASSVPPQTPVGRSGTPVTSGPLGEREDIDLNAPVDLTHNAARQTRPAAPAGAPAPIGAPAIGGAPQGAGDQQVASLPPPQSSREAYNQAASVLKSGEYEAAEIGFRDFLKKYPKSNLAPDAMFSLGETYYLRQRPREAAEQYLKVSTDFAQSRRAPEALVKLALSLEKLGAKEQACAALGEVGRKYPNASVSVKGSAEREIKRAQC